MGGYYIPQEGCFNHLSEYFHGTTLKVLDTHPKEHPFFLFLSYQSVHAPLQAPASYRGVCNQFKNDFKRIIYCAMLASMDESIGIVLERLKQRGIFAQCTEFAGILYTYEMKAYETHKIEAGFLLDGFPLYCRKSPNGVLAMIWVLLAIGWIANAHQCAYRPPKPEDVILSLREPIPSRHIRSLHSGFHIHSSFDRSVEIQPQNVVEHLKKVLIPHAIEFWTSNLRLKGGGINGFLLERSCIGGSDYRVGDRRLCSLGCSAESRCGEAIIPDRHLYKCLNNPQSVPNEKNPIFTHFILYVSAVNSSRCEDENTVAYAVHCQQNSRKRPIAGNVNICPNALSTRPHDQELLVSTIKHEIAHALVFSDALFPDFPTNPVKSFERDWPLKDGQVVKRRHYLISSKRVTEEVRKHFNCSELMGAELEDQGGYGTAMVHWEKRLFENEAMTGTHTQDPIYSRITLALFEDSGWYEVSYGSAEELEFGRGLGCEFAKLTCGEWMRKQEERGLSISPFCRLPKHDGEKSLAVTRCGYGRNALSFCNLIPYSLQLVPYYQYFENLEGIRTDKVGHYGGSVELADFCPFFQAFTWRDPQADNPLHRDSRCELEINSPDEESNSIMEVYGSDSKCFEMAVSWTEKRCGRVKTYTQYLAGCYGLVCDSGRVWVRVANTTDMYPCYFGGQHIHIRKISNGWLKEGRIVCPECGDVCSTCLEEMEPPERIVGDPPLAEPCGALRPIFSLILLLVSFLLCSSSSSSGLL